jgi:hypothetical protein
VQDDLSKSVAVLLNVGAETLALARSTGFRCFTDMEGFKTYFAKAVPGKILTP